MISKPILFTFLFLLHSGILDAQVLLGNDIDGEAAGDNFGSAVALSEDGNILAVGANFNNENGDFAGHARVFQYTNDDWTQLGNDIDGAVAGDVFGGSVALSADGSILAVGALGNDDNGNSSGHVRVFQFINNEWIQFGNNINGEAAENFFGHSVALSEDGNILAVGARNNDGNGFNAGHVRVFKFINNEWIQIGDDIDGEGAGDLCGWSIALSDDGNILAASAIGNDGNGNSSGHVRIFQFINNQWIQIGNDIDGEAQNDEFGYSVALSANGSTLAVGAADNDGNGSNAGHVRVFHFNNNQWMQIGNDIEGEAAGDFFGHSIALSEDGNTLVAGATHNDENGTNAGHARIFQLINNQWIQIGDDIDGEAVYDRFGHSIAISGDGNILATGALHNDGNGNDSGHVRVFQKAKPNLTSNDLCFTLDFNPSTTQYILEGDLTNCNIFVLDENENVVQFLLNINDKIIIELDDLSDGLHFIRVEHQTHDALFVQEIIKQ